VQFVHASGTRTDSENGLLILGDFARTGHLKA
jgi:hypothetical protein